MEVIMSFASTNTLLSSSSKITKELNKEILFIRTHPSVSKIKSLLSILKNNFRYIIPKIKFIKNNKRI